MPSKRVRCIDLSRRFAGPASRETTQTGIHGARAEDEVRNAASAPGVTIVTDIDRKPFEEAIRLSRLFAVAVMCFVIDDEYVLHSHQVVHDRC
jgi:hypothetical protein